ncbi:S-methyl-5-thioribose kinase [Ancylobacter dichloromethanicus]|uniref:S-methyl-5-thioribose kinase n=1 Tax=Ancylobacter dichloromethanicus TaxID=518825 RepID=A0A9W6JAJ8_9HYPH|nr:S-methyl-5-thioribose kinase [Ancylobacter dichloromethanicus]MBS7552047.1 S-methyl-5-thioribose kinase [Ancylobacter dichloromethanicus]GLK72319.1 methylthioribose kinase [Ancylobacter dichloromethanicus]
MLTHSPYEPLQADTLADRLGGLPQMTARIGPPAQWRVSEIGDGNLNLVFIVEGAAGSVVVKQALPYARVVGESWPMSLDRSFFEQEALLRLGRRDPGRLPEIYYFDRHQAIQIMEHLRPHVILRKGLMAGERFPLMAGQLGRYLARTLFRGSDWAMETARRKADLALFAGNVELCGITEDLFFTDPFHDCARNSHSPGLDSAVAAIRADRELKLAALELKARFCGSAQTLLHGDLHTGSIMVCAADTRIIDAEFATYGPMGFDIGSLLANLWMAVFALPGLRPDDEAMPAYRGWILDTAETIWTTFAEEFTRLWHGERGGILGGRELFEDQADAIGSELALNTMLDGIWRDAVGFAGIEIHRRILGLAHIPEFETITDEARRAGCEYRALMAGRVLAVERGRLATIGQVRTLIARLEGRDL